MTRSRIVITPGTLTGKVEARRRHLCQSHLSDQHYIEPGDLYVATALPPDHPDIGNAGWWHARYCLACAPAEFSA